ncbi:MAG TPA: hypothetical protein PKD05_02940 [Candidatus Melainabacteria bacterium]|nr:hypothetical protein [Candidatus Melainabacteria bacterium]
MRRFRRSKSQKQRSSEGIYLVELLVAISIGAMLTLALLNTAAIALRHASATQNEVYANTIISELLEATRSTSYQELRQRIGEHTLLTNKNSGGDSSQSPQVRVEALQLDAVDKVWQFTTKSGSFPGDVTYTIEDGPVPGETIRVKVKVSWRDSMRYASAREVSASTVVADKGIFE